ncbi:MAG: glycoside hydrolase family 3 N-terminal domain-containing protein [Bacteroides sp.]
MSVTYRTVAQRIFFVGLFLLSHIPLFAYIAPTWLQDSSAASWADSVLSTLSLEEQIAQAFMVVSYAKGEKHEDRDVAYLITKKHIGGVMFLQGKREKMRELCTTYQSKSKLPLLLALDAEWGTDMRMSDGIAYPKAMGVAATNSPALAYRMGEEIAKELQEIGLHINFAPVVDVQRNPKNPVIGIRGFSDNPTTVSQFGIAYMAGMQAKGLLACAKHFPGHGNTSTDSHHTLPIIKTNYTQLDTCDLVPFRQLTAEGLSMVMVAHIALPGLKLADSIPASLQYSVTTTLLRDSLGFQGLVCTDALNMKGATGKLKPDEVALQAYLAGADILLCPENVSAGIKAIQNAVKQKKISAEEIARRTRRILQAKYIANRAQQSQQKLYEKETAQQHNATEQERKDLGAQIAQESITLLQNSNNTLPILTLESQKIGCVSFLPKKNDLLLGYLQRYAEVKALSPNFSKSSIEAQATLLAKEKTLLIIAVSATGYSPSKNFGLNSTQIAFAKACAHKIPTILLVLGIPYVQAKFFPLNQFAAVLHAYDDTEFSQDALAQVIFGARPALGTFPISLPPDLKFGDGILTSDGVRVAYTSPSQYGANALFIAQADSLAKLGIDSAAYPGIQILAYHKGVIFYRKNLGATSYSKFAPPVTDSTIYDLASVTKITATTPLIMRLVEKKK